MDSSVIINQTDVFHIIRLRELIYCNAAKGYCEIYMLSGEKITVSRTLTNFSKELNPHFIRVSQSVVVNVLFIKKISKKEKIIILHSGQKIPYTIKTTDLIRLLEKKDI